MKTNFGERTRLGCFNRRPADFPFVAPAYHRVEAHGTRDNRGFLHFIDFSNAPIVLWPHSSRSGVHSSQVPAITLYNAYYRQTAFQSAPNSTRFHQKSPAIPPIPANSTSQRFTPNQRKYLISLFFTPNAFTSILTASNKEMRALHASQMLTPTFSSTLENLTKPALYLVCTVNPDFLRIQLSRQSVPLSSSSAASANSAVGFPSQLL